MIEANSTLEVGFPKTISISSQALKANFQLRCKNRIHNTQTADLAAAA